MAPNCPGSCAQHRAHRGAAETPWVQQRPPGSFPMGELCPGAVSQSVSALCPFTTELCGSLRRAPCGSAP